MPFYKFFLLVKPSQLTEGDNAPNKTLEANSRDKSSIIA